MCLDEIKTAWAKSFAGTCIKGRETQGKNNQCIQYCIFPLQGRNNCVYSIYMYLLILPLVYFSAGEGWSVSAPPHPRAAPLHSAGGTDHRTAVMDRRQDDKL